MAPGSMLIGDIFQLSAQLLTLPDSEFANDQIQIQPSAPPLPQPFKIEPSSQSVSISLTCHACGVGTTAESPPFSSLIEQRTHFKSDWHKLNVKKKLLGQNPISETEFHAQFSIADDMSSLSGSSSEGEDDWPEPLDAVREGERDDPGDMITTSTNQLPQFIFSSQDRRLAVWRCLLIPDQTRGAIASSSSQDQLQKLKDLVNQPNQATWILVMLRGGHFAAAVCRSKLSSATSTTEKKQGAQHQQSQQADAALIPFDIVEHKTFHRYVVRAKAGGKQSTKDGSKSINSAGSSLRRYNESALEKDIQDLFTSWASHLASSQLIFVHAPSSNARAIFSPSGSSGSPLSSSDPRVRRVPFLTQRPTFSELKRVLGVLSSLYEVPLASSAIDSNKKVKGKGKGKGNVKTEVVSSDARGGLGLEVDSEEEEEEEEQEEESPMGPSTALHRAARSGDSDLVSFLLETGSDPTVRDEHGRTAYSLSSDKATRDVFRRVMAQLPDRWNWRAAQVPSALTEELEASHQAKKAEKRAKLKAKNKAKKKEGAEADEVRRKREEEEAALAVEREVALAAAAAEELSSRLNVQPSKKVGPGSGRGVGQGRGSAAGVGRGGGRGVQPLAPQPPTPEEMARRRQLQAEAAEARMKALQQASMQQKLH